VRVHDADWRRNEFETIRRLDARLREACAKHGLVWPPEPSEEERAEAEADGRLIFRTKAKKF